MRGKNAAVSHYREPNHIGYMYIQDGARGRVAGFIPWRTRARFAGALRAVARASGTMAGGSKFAGAGILEIYHPIVICGFIHNVAFCDIRTHNKYMENANRNRQTKPRKGETMKREIIYRLMNAPVIVRGVATLHVDANASECIAAAFANLDNVATARGRDIAYFAAAFVARHYSNQTAYSVLFRAVANGLTS